MARTFASTWLAASIFVTTGWIAAQERLPAVVSPTDASRYPLQRYAPLPDVNRLPQPNGDFPRVDQPFQPPISRPVESSPRFVVPPAFPPFNEGPPSYQPRPDTAQTPWTPPAPKPNLFEQARVLAVVGDQHILVGDVLPQIEQILEPYKDKAPKAQLDEQRQVLMRQLVKSMVENKILYLEFLKAIPPEKRSEALPNIMKKMYEEYDREELPNAMKKAEVNTPAELDAKLRQYGSTLEKQKRAYMESKLGRAAIGQNVNVNPDVTYLEMVTSYRETVTDFQRPAQARWQQVSVHFDKFDGNRDAAYQAILEMGKQIYLGGAPMEAVARKSSHEPRASDGGFYDWTTKGSLASDALDNAIFTQEPGKLGPPIEDERGFHIVRVIERKDAHVVSFKDAQVDIKEKIKKEKMRKAIQEYIAKIKQNVPVWTAFDADKDKPAEPRM